MNNKIVEKRINILLEAIKDTQGIIGKLDTKARFYLAIYLAILGGHIAFLIRLVDRKFEKTILFVIIILVIFATVILTLYLIHQVSVKVISPKSGHTKLPFEFQSTIFFPKSFQLEEFLNKLNNIQRLDDIEKVLAVELLKVSAIREEKIKALNEIEVHHIYLIILILIEVLIFFFEINFSLLVVYFL